MTDNVATTTAAGRDYAIPVLASLDFDETAAFYEKLGFETAGRFPDYLIVTRGAVELHFWACPERHIAENTACYIQVADVQGWFDAIASLDLSPGRSSGLADQPHSMREFHILDCHGNLLRIGQPI